MGQLGLLERERELALVEASIAAATAGNGSLLVIDGPAGIGKTAIIEHGCSLADRAGMTVLQARGGLHEHDLAHGVVRQLLEPHLRGMTDRQRAAALGGAAGLASPVVAAGPALATEDVSPAGDPQAILHGLYWLTANLADTAPLLIAVDDVQWADASSLLYLLYLARRLEGLPILVLLGVRGGEGLDEALLLAEIAAATQTPSVRPAALSEAAVGDLVRDHLGADAAPGFIAACHEVTGGIPFLVLEVLKALAVDGVRPADTETERVKQFVPAAVVAAVMLRIARLSAASAPVARAVAILGRRAEIRLVAALAEVDQPQALAAADALVSAAVLRNARPLSFVHPLLAAAVDEDMPSGTRSILNARAARLLADEGCEAEGVAAHLLSTDPDGWAAAVPTLSAAAEEALSRGASQSAAAYLRRALAEPVSGAARGALLHRLGTAEALLRDPHCLAHLQEAMVLAVDARERAAVARELAPILLYAGQLEAATGMVRSTVAELGDDDPEISAELLAFHAGLALYDPAHTAEFDCERDGLEQRMQAIGKPGRPLALVLGAAAACREGNPGRAVALAERGLDNGRFIADRGGNDAFLHQAVAAFIWSDALDHADALTEAMVTESIRCGSIMGFVGGSAARGWTHTARGRLREAEVELRAAVEVAQQHDLLVLPIPVILWYCHDALLERPQLDDLATLAETIELPPALAATMTGVNHLEVRGLIRLARREVDRGIEDLTRCGEIYSALGFAPGVTTWRSSLALALPARERADAVRLVNDELELATASDMPRTQGTALRAAGLLAGGEPGIELLERSLSRLERSPAELERARTLIELGAAYRRANRRSAAREPLRAGLELAYHCGADRLAERARSELHATGARPRRPALTGRESLTPSEARVAGMAATGETNRAIAQSLFITDRTVENQLGAVYRKLGIAGRRQLATALDDAKPKV